MNHSALSLSASAASTSFYATLAKTPTGLLLRRLAAADLYALQTAVSFTRTAFKSGTASLCNGGYAEVARLLVEEYRRGAEGCMGTNQRCEFSMPLFVEDVADDLALRVADIDEAKDACLTYLGTDLGYIPPANRALMMKCPPSVR